ncbi:hypothetical protein [Nocardia brasiliensis]|uniref:Uncharacterized protein n=1 Tax=Nocardia brasiliensis (strain ATCC 700358 / HUJEG-1) TaxID=1133849 RepID=K0EZF2_NOCB7|nr:hypothetical protein [Nocardia brasiliensis]AFU02892.1 hypothetical protein O3I_024695 [Nocardia brasiliensis ATCC 700358]OCF85970.1 hypothetical protein AW168_32920 [Nocardia brasiliensis]
MINDDPARDHAGSGTPGRSPSQTCWRWLLAAAIIGAALLVGRLIMLVTGYTDGDPEAAITPVVFCTIIVILCWVGLRAAIRRERR